MSILVATDFSPEAEEACRIGADLARALGEPLAVLHVLEPATSFPLETGAATPNREVERLKVAKKLLVRTASTEAMKGVQVTTHVLNGFVEEAIALHIRTHGSTLLVVAGGGENGHSSFRDLAEKLAESMPCPVMVVREVTDRLRFALAGKHRLKIFVGIDRTLASDAPVAWVRSLRERVPCDIVANYFYAPDVEHRRLGIALSADAFTSDPTVVTMLERELRHRFAGLTGEGELRVHCEPHFGSISVEALCSARVRGADLIVVGTHRRKGVSRFLHGSVSRDIIRHSDVPVVCVGQQAPPSEAHRKIHKVLAATDLSEAGNRAIPYAFDMLSDGSGVVDIVYVACGVTDLVGASPAGEAQRLSPIEKLQLIARLERLVPSDVDPTLVKTRFIVIDGGPASDAILQAAARANVDAICLASRGRSVLERAVAGSVATEVAQGAQCPVMVIRDLAA